MSASTLPRLAVPMLLALGACSTSETATTSSAPPDPAGWVMSSGKAPSNTEFAALAATCESKGGAVEPCLTNLGLKRAQ
jgi:hypothetical protein